MPGDKPPQSTTESTDQILQALTKNLPAYMQAMNQQVLPQGQAQLQSAQELSPQYNELLSKLYEQYAPRLAQTGAQVENINRTGAAQTDVNILKGPGGELVKQAQALDKTQNPEYYATRATAADKLGQLLGSINLNNANPEAERLVSQESARTGNLSTPSATSTVSNALSFGNEQQKRRDALGQAISTASGFLQPAQSQFNPIVTALGRNSTNAGASQFAGVQNPSNQAYQSGGNLLNSATQLKTQENEIDANRRDWVDRINESIGSVNI